MSKMMNTGTTGTDSLKTMTEKEYRSHPGVNFSTLKLMQKSPMHYYWALENPGEDTSALKLGRAVHVAVLQQPMFDRTYAVMPEGIDRRTKEGKAAWAEFAESVGDRETLTVEEFDECMRIRSSIRWSTKWDFREWMTEVPLFWNDPRTGIECKCRVDAMREEDDKFVVLDLKTTTDADLKSFTRSALSYGYHMQAAHYITGVMENGLNHGKPVEWIFLAVEKKPPYAVNVIKAMPDFVNEGKLALDELMDELEVCRRLDQWPGYGTCDMSLPGWMKRNEE